MSVPNPNKIITEIYLDGDLVRNALIGLSVKTEVNRIPRARIELNYRQVEKNEGSEDEVIIQKADGFDPMPKNVKLDFLPGKEIQINLGRGQETKEVFIGQIVKQNIVARKDGQQILYVECKHKSNRMTLHKRTRFFHHDANSGASSNEEIDTLHDFDVLKHLVEDSADYDLKLEVESQPSSNFYHENMTQYNCSDWDFLVTRAEANAYLCWPDAGFIHLLQPVVQDNASVEIELGKDLLEYEAEYDETVQSERNYSTAWDVEKQEMSESNLKTLISDDPASEVQTPNFIHHYGDLSSGEMDAYLSNQVSRQHLGLVQGMAKLKGTVEIEVGQTIAITGFASVWDRNAFVSGIKHELRAGTWFTHVQCGLSKQGHAEKYQLQAQSEQDFIPKTAGLLFGTVVQYKMSEAGHELIEVEVSAYNDNDENGQEGKKTIYARLATLSAGEKGGAVFRPYPNDEVVVGFVNNDPRFPVVLGSLYNGTNTAPYEWEDHETQYEVGFAINDWKISIHEDDQLMTIASPGGQQFVLDDDDQSILMAFDDSNGIKISSDGIEMDASKIILKGSNGIEMEGMKIEAKADTSMTLEGGTQLELEGKVTASLKGQITQIN